MKVNARHLTVEDTRISVLGKPFANLPKVFPSLRERRKKKKQPPKTELTLKKPTNTQEGKFLWSYGLQRDHLHTKIKPLLFSHFQETLALFRYF